MSLGNHLDLLCLSEKVTWLSEIISDALLILQCGQVRVKVCSLFFSFFIFHLASVLDFVIPWVSKSLPAFL